MTVKRPFRFGVIVEHASSREAWIAKARRIEQLGYATLLVPDHLNEQFAPIPAMLLAAEATSTLRIGSYVFDNDYRHPAFLAKEAATLDLLSGGRLELGIGAGWLRPEYEQAGIPYDSGTTRVQRLQEAVHIIKGLFVEQELTFSGNHYTINALKGLPKPLQQPHPPLHIGGAGRHLLSFAAREANIVGIATRIRPDGGGLDVADTTPEATSRKISWLRQAAEERFNELELNIIVFFTVITENRLQAAQNLAETFQTSAQQVLNLPHCLLGTPEQVCQDLLARREQFGISYITIFEDGMEEFAPVVAQLAGK